MIKKGNLILLLLLPVFVFAQSEEETVVESILTDADEDISLVVEWE
jgi:hypothetical protein